MSGFDREGKTFRHGWTWNWSLTFPLVIDKMKGEMSQNFESQIFHFLEVDTDTGIEGSL